MAPRRLPDLALPPTITSPATGGLGMAQAVSKPRRPRTPALDRLASDERGHLLGELLADHPELVDEAERIALDQLATVDVDEVAESVEWALREADADQLATGPGGFAVEGTCTRTRPPARFDSRRPATAGARRSCESRAGSPRRSTPDRARTAPWSRQLSR